MGVLTFDEGVMGANRQITVCSSNHTACDVFTHSVQVRVSFGAGRGGVLGGGLCGGELPEWSKVCRGAAGGDGWLPRSLGKDFTCLKRHRLLCVSVRV